MSDEFWAGLYVLDENGEPMPERDLLTWARWLETGIRIVERSYVDDLLISTVFLGLDQDLLALYGEVDPLTYRPLLWETIVFCGGEVLDQARYRSKEDAIAGHGAMVEKYSVPTQP
jgi:hypothetical protein